MQNTDTIASKKANRTLSKYMVKYAERWLNDIGITLVLCMVSLLLSGTFLVFGWFAFSLLLVLLLLIGFLAMTFFLSGFPLNTSLKED